MLYTRWFFFCQGPQEAGLFVVLTSVFSSVMKTGELLFGVDQVCNRLFLNIHMERGDYGRR
jgi:hypothetical protein